MRQFVQRYAQHFELSFAQKKSSSRRWGQPGRGVLFVLGLWLLCAAVLLLPQPVAAQTDNINPQNPCIAGSELTSLTVVSGGGQSLRGIANQPVVNRTGNRVAFWSTNDLVSGNNLDGNIEVFYRMMGRDEPDQLTDSVGSILGGFNLNPSISANGNRVAFFSDRDLVPGRNVDGKFEIFLATRANNGNWSITQITDTQAGANLFPSISADGTRIAFVSDEADLHNVDGNRSNPERSFQIFLATIGNNGNVTFRQITQTGIGVTNDEPAISGDGRRIAFTRTNGNGSQIYLWDADTPNTTVRLTETNSNDQPAINADGARIAYVSTTPAGRSRIVLYIAGDDQQGDRSEVIVPQSQTRQFRSPSISDNGRRVAYVAESTGANGTGGVEVYLFDSGVHSQGGVPVTAGSSEQPAISGDGAHLVYVRLATDAINSDDVGSQIIVAECPLADLVLTPVDPVPETVLAGIDLVYSFRLTNNGPSTADSARVVLTDIARPNLVSLSTELSDARCSITTGGLTCDFGDLAPGESTQFTVAWDVPANAGLDDIRSRLVASANAIDPNPDSADSGELVTRVTEVANLILAKTGSDDTIQAGATTPFYYTLTLENEGPSRARDAVLIDTLPNNVQIVGSVPLDDYIVQAEDPNAACEITQANRVVRCELGSVPADSTTIVRIPIVATAAAPAQLTNRAEVQSETDDLTPETREATLTTTVFRPADMAISKIAEPATTVVAGNRITYTLTVTNLGTANAANVAVTDLLPENVTFVEGSSQCSAQANNSVVNCDLGNMNVNAVRVLTIVARVNPAAPAGTIENTASVISARPDPNPGNNTTDPVETQVIRLADVEVVSKTASPSQVVAGVPFRFTVTVRNNGPSTAENTVVTDNLPPGVSVVGTSSACSVAGDVVTCQVGTMPPTGTQATRQFNIDVIRTQAGSITNTADVQSDTLDDPAPGNNTGQVQVTVRPAPTSQLVYTQFPASVVAGNISGNIRIQRRDQFGNPNDIEGALTLALNTTQSGTGTFRGADDVNQVITTVQIPANSSQVDVVYRDELAGTPQLTASAPSGSGITPAQQSLTVDPGPATQLVIVTNEHTVTAGLPSPEITVQRQDQFGNANSAQPTITLLLEATADDPPGFQNEAFLENVAPFDQPITSIQITQDNSSATFRYQDERAGTKTIRVEHQAPAPERLHPAEQDITIEPDVTSDIMITTPPRTIRAGQSPTGMDSVPGISVQRVDQYGNPNVADDALTVNLSTNNPDTGLFYQASGLGSPITSVTIPIDSSVASFRYTDTFASVTQIGVDAFIGEPIFDTQTLTVTAAPADKLRFEPDTRTITAGTVSDVFTVARYDEFDNLADQDDEIVVTLATASDDGAFRDAATDTITVTSVTLGENIAQTQVRYFDTLRGTHDITGSFGVLDNATGSVTVNSAPANQLAFVTIAQTVTAGVVSDVITVQRQDPFGNPADQDGPVTVDLETSTATGAFVADDEDPLGSVIANMEMLEFVPDASFYYTDTLAGEHTITATADLPGDPDAFAAQTITITPDQARQLVFTTFEHTTVAGNISDIMTVERQDQFGNANLADPDVPLALTTNVPISATFYLPDGVTDLAPDNVVTISQGMSTTSFLYYNERVEPGTHVITATGDLPQMPDATVSQDHQILPAPPDYLRIRGPLPHVTAGISQTLTITAFDPFGNLAVDYTGVQTLTFAGAPQSLSGGFIPNVTDMDGTPRNLGETLVDAVAEETPLIFENGVAQTDTISRGIMTLYRSGEFTVTALAEANSPFDALPAEGGNAFSVTVTQGPREQFQIQDGPTEEDSLIPDQDLRSGEDLVLYVVAADAFGNGLPDEIIEVLAWETEIENPSISGEPVVHIDPLTESEVTTVTGHISGTVTIRALIDIVPVEETPPTGVITVVPGAVDSVNVETAPNNVARELVPTQEVTAGQSITVYAALRDAAGNMVPEADDPAQVAFELVDITPDVVQDDLQQMGTTRIAVFTGDQVGTAAIRATVPLTPELDIFPSGTITVVAGEPAGLEIRRAGDLASVIDVVAGQETNLIIRVYDANGNIANNMNGTRDVHFFGPAPAPDGTQPFVTEYPGGDPIPFGDPTSLNFSQGVMTHGASGQGRMQLFDAGQAQVITATLTRPNNVVIGTRTLPPGHLTANVTHAELSRFELDLTEPQTNTLSFAGTNTVAALDAFDNPVLDFSPVVTPLHFSATPGVVTFTPSGDNTIATDGGLSGGVVDLSAHAMTYTGPANQQITFVVTTTVSPASGQESIHIDGGPAQTLQVMGGLPEPWTAGESALQIVAFDGQGNYSPGYAGPRILEFEKTGFTWNEFPPYVRDYMGDSQPFGTPTTLNFDAMANVWAPIGLFAAQPAVTVIFTDTNPPAFAADPLTGTFTVDVVAAALDRFDFVLSSPQTIGTPFNDNAADNLLSPLDEYGNIASVQGIHEPISVAPSTSGTVTFTMATNNDNTLVAGDFTTNGAADLTDLGMVYVGQSGLVSFTATSDPDPTITGSSNDVLFESDTPARLELVGTGGPEVAGVPFTLTVVARDSVGNVTDAYDETVDLVWSGASNAPAGDVPQADGVEFGDPLSVTFENGVAQIDAMTLYAAETATIAAVLDSGPHAGVVSDPDYVVLVEPAPAHALFLATAPDGEQSAGEPLADAPWVELHDAFANIRTGENAAQVTASVDGPGDFTPNATDVMTMSAGTAEFTNLILNDAGLYTLTFEINLGGVTATDAVTFTVAPANAASIQLTGPPAVTAGEQSDTFTLTAYDVYGNMAPVSDPSHVVLTTSATQDFEFAPDDELTLPQASSSVSFTYRDDVAGLRTITATIAAGDPGINQQSATHDIQVNPGAPSTLHLQGPATAAAGEVSEPFTLTVHDGLGNIAPVGANTVIGLESDSGGAVTFYPDPVVIPETGFQATFTYTDTEVSSKTVTATVQSGDGTLVDANADHAIAIEPGEAAQLFILTPPDGNQTAGEPLAPAIEVQLRDALNNVVTGTSDTVTATAYPLSATLGGTTEQPLVGGTATFDDLTLTTAGVYSLSFATSAGTFTVDSATFTVHPAEPASMAIDSGNNQEAQVATAVDEPLVVQVLDQYDNPVPDVDVTFSVVDGGGTLDGEPSMMTTTTITGAAFSGVWTLGTQAGGNTIEAVGAGVPGAPVTFSATGLPGPVANVNPLPGGDGQSGTVNTALPNRLQVQLTDFYSNPVVDSVVTFTVTGGGGSLGGEQIVTVNTTVTGTAISPPWILGEVAGTNTVEAASAELPGVPVGFSATGVADSPDSMALYAGDNQTAQVGTPVDEPLVVRVLDQYTNPVPDVEVTFSIAPADGNFGGDPSMTATTTLTGIAVSDLWTLGTEPGTKTAEVVGTGVPGGPVNFNATATVGPATALSIDIEPNQSTAGQPVSPAPQVSLRDTYGNVLTHDSVSTITASVFTGPVSEFASGPEVVETVENGVATFDTLVLETADTYSLLFATSTGTFTVTSLPFTVNPATIAGYELTLTAPQTNTLAFAGPNTLRALDAHNNTLNNVDHDVIFSVDSGGTLGFAAYGGSATLPAAAFVDGVANLAGGGAELIYTGTAGSGISITAANAVTPTIATTDAIDIVAGPTTQLVIEGPDTLEDGATAGPYVVELFDASNNSSTVAETTAITLGLVSLVNVTGQDILDAAADGDSITQVDVLPGASESAPFWLTAELESGGTPGTMELQAGGAGTLSGLLATLGITVEEPPP